MEEKNSLKFYIVPFFSLNLRFLFYFHTEFYLNEIYFYAAETFFDCFITVLCKQTYTRIEAKRGFSGTLRLLRLKYFF